MLSNLKKIRKNRGITGNQMALLLGYASSSTYYKKENGKISMSLEEAQKIALILQVTVNQIY